MHDTHHWTGEIPSNFLVTYTYSPGEDTAHHEGPHSNRMTSEGPWEADFVISRVFNDLFKGIEKAKC